MFLTNICCCLILFPFILGYGNGMIMSFKKRQIKFKPGIKLNLNIYNKLSWSLQT